MKVCESCGVEIDGRDGENRCQTCDDGRKAKRRLARKEREAILRSCGLVKVRGACGGTYWE